MNEEIPTEDVIAEPQTAIAEARARPKGSFAGDVLKLVSGTTFAQALGVLLSPLLTRLYSPESFGVLALFTSITGIISVVACLRYELAIMLPERDEEAANLLAVSLLSVVAIAALSLLIVSLGRPLLLGLLRAPALGPYLWLVPLMVFFAGAFGALNYWNSRTKHFGRLSVVRVLSAVSTYTVNLGVGYAGHATGGTLIGAAVLGSALSALELGRRIWRDDKGLFRGAVRWHEMTEGMKRYRNFPLYDMWSGLLNTVSTQLPTLLLSAFFSQTVVGFYALGYRILSLPMSLVGSAIGQVFFQRASVAKADGTLTQVVESTLRRLMALAAFPFMLLAVIGPDAFAFVFGQRWLEAGFYVRILAPWLFFVFLGSPISTLYCVLERQRIGMLFNIALIITRAASLVGGGLLGDSRVALGLFALSGAALWAWFCLYLVSVCGLSRRSTARVIVGHLSGALVFILPVVLTKWVWRASSFVVLAVSVSVGVLYYARQFARDGDLRALVLRAIPLRK